MKTKEIEELIKYVNNKANKEFSDDFPIYNIEKWIREFFEQKEKPVLKLRIDKIHE